MGLCGISNDICRKCNETLPLFKHITSLLYWILGACYMPAMLAATVFYASIQCLHAHIQTNKHRDTELQSFL